MKKRNNDIINPILETIKRMKYNNIDFYNYFSYSETKEINKIDLYNCTISYTFNNYHSENCYFNILAYSHETKTTIELGTIYTKDSIIHPTIKTTFFYSEQAHNELYKFMLFLDELLNDIYFNRL